MYNYRFFFYSVHVTGSPVATPPEPSFYQPQLQLVPQQQSAAAAAHSEGYKSSPQPALSTESFSYLPVVNARVLRSKPDVVCIMIHKRFTFVWLCFFFTPLWSQPFLPRSQFQPAIPPAVLPSSRVSSPRTLLQLPSSHPRQHPPQLPDSSLPGTSLSIPAPPYVFHPWTSTRPSSPLLVLFFSPCFLPRGDCLFNLLKCFRA